MSGSVAPDAPWGHSDNRAMLAHPVTAASLNATRPRQAGFTLIELMIAVIIVAILAAVAIPSYQQFVAKGRRADAMSALSSIMQAQERFRSNKNRYASSFEELLPFAVTPKHYALTMVGAGSTPSYQLGFKVTATPIAGSSQAGDTDCASLSIRVEYGNIYYE